MEKKSKEEQKRWKANEETRQKLHENLGLGDSALKDFDLKTLLVNPHLRCYEFFFLNYEFSRDLKLFSQLFVFRFIIERVRINTLWGSTFNIEGNDPLAISISKFFYQLFINSIVWANENCQAPFVSSNLPRL